MNERMAHFLTAPYMSIYYNAGSAEIPPRTEGETALSDDVHPSPLSPTPTKQEPDVSIHRTDLFLTTRPMGLTSKPVESRPPGLQSASGHCWPRGRVRAYGIVLPVQLDHLSSRKGTDVKDARKAQRRFYVLSNREAVGNDINRFYKWFPWWLISDGAEDLRDEEQYTIEVLIVVVDEVESQSKASQQPPTHLLLDFLPTWPIPLKSTYLNSRALVKPVECKHSSALRLIKSRFVETLAGISGQHQQQQETFQASGGRGGGGGGFIAVSRRSCERDLRRVPLSLRLVLPVTVSSADCLPLRGAYLQGHLYGESSWNADIDHVRSMGSCTLSAGRSHPRYRRTARIGISGVHVT
ncbi:hypothetical protein ALC53_12117 [Atta colombica]|uniref:Uncharacterized protein n=1 Tax=Atta colombica TaxID=520822 RepID=A0A195AZ19_9HYME|nr:hypothetical protein ALC53_12117 [Atta colombica]